jgi:hypothetical protein
MQVQVVLEAMEVADLVAPAVAVAVATEVAAAVAADAQAAPAAVTHPVAQPPVWRETKAHRRLLVATVRFASPLVPARFSLLCFLLTSLSKLR